MRSEYRRYDPRLRNLVAQSGDIDYFVACGVSRSTARQWVKDVRELYTSSEFAHFSMLSLSWLAKKTGAVMASASTRSRVVRQLGLKRNRVRIYPPKPKVGIRASALECQTVDLESLGKAAS